MIDVLDRPTAREMLLSYHMPRTFQEATAYLWQRLSSLQMLNLYHDYFPDNYARSTKRPFPRSGEAYSPREAEFLELVNERLIPLYIEFLLYGIGGDERSLTIPVRPLGVDWWNLEYDDLSEIWQFIAFIIGEASLETFNEAYPDLAVPCASPLYEFDHPITIDEEQFKRLWGLAAQDIHPTLEAMPLLFDCANQNTDNLFLNANQEEGIEGFEWEKDSLDYLAEQYREADKILDRIWNLIEWLKADSANLPRVFTRLEEIINQCKKPSISVNQD